MDKAALRKEKHTAYMREFYRNNPDEAMRKNERMKYKLSRRKYWVAKYKEACGCSECGYSGHHSALDFDHIDPTSKTVDVARLLSKGSPIKVIIAEVRKCRLLCAICHRIHTFNQAQERRINARPEPTHLH